ncbi:MAG: hypothetical protein HC802_22985, partial [Caldilineaceae bacterium]|nr:hypothetical protein [Caldilineaceae bacterium]
VLVPRDGEAAGPGDFVSVIIYGPAEVAVASLIAAGERVTVAEGGSVRALRRVEVDGVQLAEAAPSLGVALEDGDSDGNGRIWVMVNPQ